MLQVVGINDYRKLVTRRGGKCIALDQSTTVTLPPIDLAGSSHSLVQSPDDIKFLEYQLGDTIRGVPELVFETSGTDLYIYGLPALEGLVCSPLMRTGKFVDRVNKLSSTSETPPPFAVPAGMAAPLLMGPFETFNYSHWLLEGLPKIKLYQRATGYLPQSIIIAGAAVEFHRQSLEYVAPGIGLIEVFDVPSRIGRIAYTTSTARSVTEIHPSVFQFYRDIVSARFAGFTPDRRRIIISRAGASHRRMLNETALADALAPFGFSLVSFDKMPFAEQIEQMWNAEVVVGTYGAGLTNLVFASNCRLVAEALSSGFRDASTYAHICRHKGIRYLVSSGRPVQQPITRGERDPEGWPGHQSFELDIKPFVDALTEEMSLLGLAERPGAGIDITPPQPTAQSQSTLGRLLSPGRSPGW